MVSEPDTLKRVVCDAEPTMALFRLPTRRRKRPEIHIHDVYNARGTTMTPATARPRPADTGTLALLAVSKRDRAGPKCPPEICDIIIDFLHKDTRALCACNLVCRSWRAAARYHLFRAIKLSAGRAHAFLGILSRAPGLARHVRDVTVDFYAKAKDSTTAVNEDAAQAQARALRPVFDRLRHVSILRVAALQLTAAHTALFTVLAAPVRILGFAGFLIAPEPALLAGLLRLFRSLEVLALPPYCTVDEPRRRVPCVPASLHTLSLHLGSGVQPLPELSYWVAFHFTAANIRHLVISASDGYSPSRRLGDLLQHQLPMVLRAMGPALLSLSLTIPTCGLHGLGACCDDVVRCSCVRRRDKFAEQDPRRTALAASLDQCTNLYRLILITPPSASCSCLRASATPIPPAWIPQLLGGIRTDSVRVIYIGLASPRNDFVPRDFAWIEELSLVLSRLPFRYLEKLEFCLNERRHAAELNRFIQREMPELRERGLGVVGRKSLRVVLCRSLNK